MINDKDIKDSIDYLKELSEHFSPYNGAVNSVIARMKAQQGSVKYLRARVKNLLKKHESK